MNTLIAFLLALFCLMLAGPASAAGSVDAGRAWFQAPNGLCLSCHVDPPTAARYVLARFNPAYLASAFQRNFAMSEIGPLLGAQGINDVATYLGLVGLGKPNANDTDRLLDWGEDTFPQLLSPARQPTQQVSGYTYRFYPATGVYVATKDGGVWFFDSRTPGATILPLGSLRSFLDQMPNGR